MERTKTKDDMVFDAIIGNVAVVVPVYNPEPALVGLCSGLVKKFRTVLVVDDGSTDNVTAFSKLPESVVLLRHGKNFGKGAAIKTALRYLKENTQVEHAVFADGDGQHVVEDIASVARRADATGNVVFGVRDFTRRGIPFRSWFGNACTAYLVRFLKGIRIADTQTGLRAIPRRLFSALAQEPGDRYEFEIRIFDFLKRKNERIEQVPIATVYVDSNRSSHFRPIVDSFRIYRTLFGGMFLKFCASSLLGFAIDNLVFTGLIFALQDSGLERRFGILFALIGARFISSTCNFLVNFKMVFKSHGSIPVSYARYWGLVLLIAGLSYLGTSLLSDAVNARGWTITSVKVGIETALFILSYKLQKKWVFMRSRESRKCNCCRDLSFNVPELAFLGMLLSAILAMLLFMCGLPLSSVSFWCGVAFACWMASRVSFGSLAGVLGIYAVGVALSVLIESYSATDAMRAYFPMQRLLAEGWNPIYGLDTESIRRLAETSDVGLEFIRFTPNLNALIAAMVDKAFRIFSGDCFCGVVMVLVVFSSAYRLGVCIWRSRFGAFAIAAGIAMTTNVTSFLSGHVDYTVYSMMSLAAISLALWIEERRMKDLVLLFLACSGAMASKATGVPFAFLFFVALVVMSLHDVQIRKPLACGIGLTLILCCSPYIVNMISTGSCFPSQDLTSDFTGNEDALRMGYFQRLLYAWVSPALAKYIGSAIYHSDFSPMFSLNVKGFGLPYRLAVLLLLPIAFVSRRKSVILVSVLLFVSGNLLPLKYIGFSRYCPQLWCVPFLMLLNVPSLQRKSYVCSVVTCGRNLVCAGILCWVAFICVRTTAYAASCIAWHEARMQKLDEMKNISDEWRLEGNMKVKCTAMKLLSLKGLKVVKRLEAPVALFDQKHMIISASPIDEARLAEFKNRFGICDSPKALMKFDWLGAFQSPHL